MFFDCIISFLKGAFIGAVVFITILLVVFNILKLIVG